MPHIDKYIAETLTRDNLYRLWALSTPFPRQARVLHRAADRLIDAIVRQGETQR